MSAQAECQRPSRLSLSACAEPVKGFETTFLFVLYEFRAALGSEPGTVNRLRGARPVGVGPVPLYLQARVGHPSRWACRDDFACLRGCPREADRRQSFRRDPSGSASEAWPTFRPWCEAYQWSVEPLPSPLAGTSRRRTRTRTVDIPDQSLPIPDGRDRNSASRELRGNERATHRRARVELVASASVTSAGSSTSGIAACRYFRQRRRDRVLAHAGATGERPPTSPTPPRRSAPAVCVR